MTREQHNGQIKIQCDLKAYLIINGIDQTEQPSAQLWVCLSVCPSVQCTLDRQVGFDLITTQVEFNWISFINADVALRLLLKQLPTRPRILKF